MKFICCSTAFILVIGALLSLNEAVLTQRKAIEQATIQGQIDAGKGFPPTANPYAPRNTQLYEAWMTGWRGVYEPK